MSSLEPDVDLFTLHLDARATVQAALDAFGQDADSAAFQEILAAVEPGMTLSATIRRPEGERPILIPRYVSTVDDAVAALVAAGVLSAATVWREPATDAYISQTRCLTAVRVHAPFRVRLSVLGAATEEHAAIVADGWYLLGEVGDIIPALVGVASIDPTLLDGAALVGEVAERLTTRTAGIEEFGASRCEAGCTACGRRWCAEAGSWHFAAEGDGTDWFYDDAYGFDGGTIACPTCDTGRVGFTIS